MSAIIRNYRKRGRLVGLSLLILGVSFAFVVLESCRYEENQRPEFNAQMSIESADERMTKYVHEGMSESEVATALKNLGLENSEAISHDRLAPEGERRRMVAIVRHSSSVFSSPIVVRDLQFIFVFDEHDLLDRFYAQEVLTGP